VAFRYDLFDPDVLAICRRLVGETMVMCQFATDTDEGLDSIARGEAPLERCCSVAATW
jgi:hypothetical protein